jgi:1,2-phenylacetyl-CoA epoxidase PaaB subunit
MVKVKFQSGGLADATDERHGLCTAREAYFDRRSGPQQYILWPSSHAKWSHDLCSFDDGTFYLIADVVTQSQRKDGVN